MAINMKNIRQTMRKDDGVNGDAQRLEQTIWMLFMKLFDSKEDEWELKAGLQKETYESAIPEKYRWKKWALDERGMTGDELIEFTVTEQVNKLGEEAPNNELNLTIGDYDNSYAP